MGSRGHSEWLVAVGLSVALGSLSLSLAGLVGTLTPVSVAAILGASLAVGIAYGAWSGSRPRLSWVALPLLALTAAPTLAALLPPHTWDEVAYGAALPRDYARAGRMYYNADYGPYSAFPANYEALATASLLLTHDLRLTQLLNVGLTLGLALMASRLAERLGAKRHPSLLAALLVLCAPALIDVAPQTKNDVAAAFFQTLAVLVLVESSQPIARTPLLLSGAFLGTALGTKYSSLSFGAAFGPAAALFIVATATSRTDGLRRVALWAASVAVFGSPWYLRNLALFSNPLFPFANDWLGAHNGLKPEQSELLREMFNGLADFSLKTGSVATFAARLVNGFGAVPMALMLPGAWLALRPARRPVGALLAGTGVAYFLLTLFAGLWEPRYFLSLLVLSSALASLAFEGLGGGALASAKRGAVAALGLVVAATLALFTAGPGWRDQWHGAQDLWREGRGAYIARHVSYFAVAQWLNAHLGENDRVAIGFNIQPFYYLERSYYHIHPLTQGDLVSAQTPEDVEAALRAVGATYLAFSGSDGTYSEDTAPKVVAYHERLWIGQRRLRQQGRLRLLATIDGVRILRLVGGEPGILATRPPDVGR